MHKSTQHILSDEAVRKLVLSRLSVLSPDFVISLGAEGSFSRDELITRVQAQDPIGEKLAEIEMHWLRSFKEAVRV